jgi:hypothetical protein
MVTVKLTKDITHQGLSEGDVLSVDKFSAATLVERGDAVEYEAAGVTERTSEPGRYGGQEAETIDDIHDPDVERDRRVQVVTRVGVADRGPALPPEPDDTAPVTEDTPTPSRTKSAKAAGKGSAPEASGAQPAGGDAGGGDGS